MNSEINELKELPLNLEKRKKLSENATDCEMAQFRSGRHSFVAC